MTGLGVIGLPKRHGRLVQVELDALPPDRLRDLYAEAIADFWDTSAYESAIEREHSEAAGLGDTP